MSVLYNKVKLCAAGTLYILFRANFRLNKIPLKFVTCFGGCSFGQKMQLWTCLFFKNYIIYYLFEDDNCVRNCSFK